MTPRFLRLAGFVVLVTASACAAPVSEEEPIASTQQAITNGVDDDADSAVVALLQDGKVFCTGVLLTPNVVATAAHCVSPTPPQQIYFGSDPTSKKGRLIDVASSRVHPDFDEDTLENDIAVVGLAVKAPVAPLNVISRDFDDSFIGRDIRLVGFGATGPGETTVLRKRSGTTAILSYTADDFRFSPGPSQTCVGDSGGPALATVGDHEAVIGLTSSGDGKCRTYGRDMRIDRYVPFIKSYATAYSIPTGPRSVENQGCSIARAAGSGRSSPGGSLALAAVALLLARVTSRRAGAAARAACAWPARSASTPFAANRSRPPAR